MSEGGFQGPGGAESLEFAKKLAAGHVKGITLIVVAGMNYADNVEALNYDVLTSAELLAEQLVPQILEKLGLK